MNRTGKDEANRGIWEDRFVYYKKQPYEFKRKYAQIRAEEFKSECDRRGLNCHVSVGGLDSIVLFLFLREVCQIDVPGVSASTLEDKSIQKVHKAIGIINVPPLKRDDGKLWTKGKGNTEFGFPVISKEIAGKIELLRESYGEEQNSSTCDHNRRDWRIRQVAEKTSNAAEAEIKARTVRRIWKRKWGMWLPEAGL